MKRLLKFAALGAIGVGIRKLLQSRSGSAGSMGKSAADVDLRQPQKTVQQAEAKAGEPVRP